MSPVAGSEVGERVFCTLFDSNYFSRGLAMYQSLARNCQAFVLYIFAFDDQARRALLKLALPHVRVVSLEEFEDEELLRVKPARSRAEYCWTSTPSTVLYVLEKMGHSICTYLDADTYFFSSPDPLLVELGADDVTITEHRYSPQYAGFSATSGIYNVQFVTFRATPCGLTALRWWRNACLDSCELNPAEGKCGDQKYLDDWPQRFEGIHVLQHLGGGIAPWNVQQYFFERTGTGLRGTELRSRKDFDVIFFHFHALKLTTGRHVHLSGGGYDIDRTAVELLYKPYIAELDRIGKDLKRRGMDFDPHGLMSEPTPSLRERLGRIKRRITATREVRDNANIPYEIDDLLSD
jgi:hypothetical protein